MSTELAHESYQDTQTKCFSPLLVTIWQAGHEVWVLQNKKTVRYYLQALALLALF